MMLTASSMEFVAICDIMELFIMTVYTEHICNISAYNIYVCEKDQQRL